MAKLKLNIIGDISDVEQKITTIKTSLKTIENEHVKIQVDTSGLDKIDTSVTKYLNAQARLSNAHAREVNAQARVIEARAKLKEATDALAVSENKLKEAQAKSETETKKKETADAQAELQTRKRETAEAQLELQIEKTTTADRNLEIQTERTNTVTEQRQRNAEMIRGKLDLQANATRQTSKATEEMSDKTEELSDKSSLLGGSLTTVAAKMAVWQIMGALISAPIRAIREAIETLKAVDSALVTVQKTTGFSEEQLDDLTGKTYELAAAYGRTADELLNMSATFARAGFTDQLVQMTELAALLQNVGDLEEDTATKFLLAANAAWQLNGDYASLMEIIDGMNMVTNQAAVDMEALTTGITVAGSVFANAGESAQTYTALVGTAVAATQRSGSEIARGLRTIAMNVRAIKGELDDGEIIDDETISDAAAALASVGISVADARGELRLTSDVLADLAQKWDNLTTGEQSYIAQSLAGKRQANVLTALMQNWGEVERQMALYADGAGSALQENEIYLDSWEAKSKQLDATWTKLISDLIETDTVKGSLDTLTGAIEFLDSGFGKAAISAGLAAAAVVGLYNSTGKLTGAVKKLTEAIASNPYLAIGAAAVAALVAIASAIDTENEKIKETAKALRDEAQALGESSQAGYEKSESLATLIKKYQELNEVEQRTQGQEEEYQGILSSITGLLGDRASALEGLVAGTEEYTKALKDLLAAEVEQALFEAGKAKAEANAALSDYARTNDSRRRITLSDDDEINRIIDAYNIVSATGSSGMPILEVGLSAFSADDIEAQLDYYNRLLSAQQAIERAAQRRDDYDLLLTDQYKVISESVDAIEPYILAVESATAAEERWKDVKFGLAKEEDGQQALIDRLSESAEDAADSMDDAATAAQELSEKISGLKTADYAKDAISALTSATKEFEEYGGLTSSTLEKLETLFPGITDALYDVNGNLTDTAREALSSAGGLAALAQEFQTVTVQGRNMSLTDARAELDSLNQMAFASIGALGAYRAALESAINGAENNWNTITVNVNGLGASTTGGSSGGGTKTDTRKTGYEEKLKLLQSQLTLMQAQGASVEEQAAKMREIQDALHEEAEYLRTTQEYLDGDASAIAEVNGLSSEWWSWNEKILKVLQEQEDQLLANAAAVRDEMLAAIDAELDKLKEAHDTKEDQLKLEEKILAVQQAQADLANAQAERTVRYYNALTGQWEWAADAQKVKSAQEALTKAQDDLSDYQREQAYNARVNALNAQKSSVNSAYDSLAGMSDAEKIAWMRRNSAAWYGADDAERSRLNQENRMIAASMGATYNAAEGRYYLNGQPLYDRGGVLRGVGGIKATRRDEIILPPDVTKAMLNPVADRVLLTRMDELRYLYGAGTAKAGSAAAGGIGKQINGNVYELGGVTLTEQQARATTVYELAQLARTLKTRNSVN